MLKLEKKLFFEKKYLKELGQAVFLYQAQHWCQVLNWWTGLLLPLYIDKHIELGIFELIVQLISKVGEA